VHWNLRMCAAERGIWKATHMRALLAAQGLVISTGKMSGLWTGTPVTLRLADLEVICRVLDCQPGDLLVRESAAPSPPTAPVALRAVPPVPEARAAAAPAGAAVRRTAPPL
jgi:putative transcriptional regulator